MDLKELKEYLDKLATELESKDKKFLEEKLKDLISVFPFNEYEYILIFFRDKGIITFEEYEKLRENYVNSNKYLSLYGIAPRVFGQIWGEENIRSINSRFKKANKKLDPDYSGHYDIWFDGIKLEVKACRAINTKKRGDLVSKALCYNSKEPFWMNFQQLKPDTCDVFVFIGVWVDQIVYWVMSSKEVKENEYLSHQHEGGIEYQIGITHKNISDFNIYKASRSEITSLIIKKSKQ
jgi:hypothetical protein